MVYNEEICSWFGKASGWERIDLMCKLLQQCTALELRFIGSCVEVHARKDFHGLRECELKANDANEISKLPPDIYDDRTRSLLNIYISPTILHQHPMLTNNVWVVYQDWGRTELSNCQAFCIQSQICRRRTFIVYHGLLIIQPFHFIKTEKLWECSRNIETLYVDATNKVSPYLPWFVRTPTRSCT